MRLSTFHLPLHQDHDLFMMQLEAVAAAGIEQVWFTEHHTPQSLINNPLMFIASLMHRLPTLSFGTAVLPVRLWDLDRLVEDLRLIEALHPGRTHIGLGARPAGSQPEADDEAKLIEAIAAVRAIVGETRVWTSTVAEAGWAFAAEQRCGVLASPPLEDETVPARCAIHRSLQGGNRDLQFARVVYVIVSERPAEVLTPSFFISAEELTALGRGQVPPATAADRLSSRLIAGTEAAVLEQFEVLAESGVSHALCCLDLPGMNGAVRQRTVETLGEIERVLDRRGRDENGEGVPRWLPQRHAPH
ncbi:MAG: LLM class flavin-dependent oxidoreductase [Pseudomonadota bacterium]